MRQPVCLQQAIIRIQIKRAALLYELQFFGPPRLQNAARGSPFKTWRTLKDKILPPKGFIMQNQSVRKMTRAAIIAAVYVALCLALPMLSYGPVQVRFSEALTLLPVLCPEAVIGLTVGCFIANLFGGMPADMIFGTLATLLASLVTYVLRAKRTKKGLAIVPALPPVLFNAVIVGAELSWLFLPAGAPAVAWLANMLSVGIGQLVSCGLGVVLVWAIEKNPVVLRLFLNGSGGGAQTLK